MAAAKVSALFLAGLVLTVLLLVPAPGRAGDVTPQPLQAASDWAMYGASADHGFTNAGTPPDALGLVWTLPANGALGGASAVEAGGFVYLADFDTTPTPPGPQLKVYKVAEVNGSASTGWSTLINVDQASSFAQSYARGVPRSLAVSTSLAANLVYVLFTAANATLNREVVTALNVATGSIEWSFAGTQTWTNATAAGTRSAPVITSGIVAFGSQDGNVYALYAANGTLAWWAPASAAVQTVPAIVGDYVYVVAGSILRVFDLQGMADMSDGGVPDAGGYTGDILWDLPLSAPTIASPVVFDRYVFVDVAGDLLKVDRINGGTPIWVLSTQYDTTGTPALDGAVVGGNPGIVTRRSDGRLYAYNNRTGQLDWVHPGLGAGTGGGDLSIADGRVFLSARSGTTYDLVALDAADGTVLFRNTTAGRPSMGAPIVAGSKVLVTEGPALLAFRGQPDLAPTKVVMSKGTAIENVAHANITVTVQNLGDEPVSGVHIQVYDGNPVPANLIGEFTIGTSAKPLAANGIANLYTAERDWTVKEHDVWVVIARAPTETNDANNAKAFPIFVQPGPPPGPVVLGAGPYALALLGGFGIGLLVLWFPLQRLRELRRKESEK